MFISFFIIYIIIITDLLRGITAAKVTLFYFIFLIIKIIGTGT